MAVDLEMLNKYVGVAEEAAVMAGKLIQTSFYQHKTVEHKGKVDLVTETDKACEKIIFDHLSKAFPTHQLLGEETSSLSGKIDDITDEPTWIVDPLDGTTNFVHSFPFVCVSIGLTIGKVPVVGVVYNPILDELYTATKGGGAFLNGQLIAASDQSDIGNALLATEVGTARDVQTVDASTNRIKALLFKVRSLRMSGSCAMNLCGVACGRLDIFYEIGFGGPWDVAAGALIVQEAGGHVFDPSGKPFDIMSHRVCSTNSQLKEAVIEALSEHC